MRSFPLTVGFWSTFTKNLTGIFLSVGILLGTLGGCSSEQPTLEDDLCRVYKSVNDQSIKDISSREGVLAETMQSELPVFFEDHYVNLVQVDWEQRAGVLNRLLSALDDAHSQELCVPITNYYQR